jgi:site-specific DNA recombinase
MNAPSKSGKIWSRRSVHSILINPAYTGKTYTFTTIKNRKRFIRPQSDWIVIEGVTPAIITQELFDAAQKQLQINRTKTVPTTKHEYMLRGHICCRHCGRVYVASVMKSIHHGKGYSNRYYRCTGKLKLFSPITRCDNKAWSAKRIEDLVWSKLVHYLSDYDLIMSELKNQRQSVDNISVFEKELERIEHQIQALNREQHQLLQWALKDFPPDQVESENKRLNKAKEIFKAQKIELEAQIKANKAAIINLPNMERFIKDIHEKLPNLDFESKRLALEMLGITVWLDGESIEVTGRIEPQKQSLRCSSHRDDC